MEEAFDRYQAAALKGASTGDWKDWANCFTPDATYIGTRGRAVTARLERTEPSERVESTAELQAFLQSRVEVGKEGIAAIK